MKMNTRKRWLGILLAVIMIFSGSAYGIPNVTNMANVVEAAEVTPRAGTNDYGLADNIQDGVILHCFDWKYSDIEAELSNIAAAGFTSVQTSPAQRNDSDGEPWYMLYQPQGFAIASNQLGTKAELESLCKKAEEYGIKIVVDVVANHTRGMDGNNGPIDDNLKNSNFFRWNNIDSASVDWTNRYQVYTCNIGMRDLVSENTELQQIILNYTKELQSVGVDGIRWDAAKHIQLPSEGSDFWKTVTSQGLWHYGEILDGPNNGGNNNDNLMKEYTNYISVTDDVYGKQVLEGQDGSPAFTNGKVPNSIGNYSERGVSKDKLVYWAESHDTYANDGEYGQNTSLINQNIVDRAYALVAAQGKATALYFSRPYATTKVSIKPGVKGSTHFTSKEVAEVNHLHNAVIGEKEYYVRSNDNSVAAVCRESGAVVVLGSGGNRDVTVDNGGGTVKPGTYTDRISGNTWTVTASTMSGRVGDTGIVVFYEEPDVVPTPKPTISKEGGNFNDTLTLTIGLSNATSGTYKIGNGAAETYTGTKTITIGSDMAFGESVTITLTATDGTDTTTKEYTFKKVEETGNVVYLSLPSGWNTPVYCYAYVSGVTPAKENAKWPGEQMTLDAATGYYKYEIPEDMDNARVIISDTGEVHRTTPDGVDGQLINGSWIYKDGAWSEYSSPVAQGKVIVQYVDASGNSVAAQKTLTGAVGSAYTTTAVTVSGYQLKQTPANASGTYTAADITVKYVYEKTSDSSINITSSQPDGYAFSTETATITIKTENATSATYSVDNGPVRTFNGSANVVIGQGKIADRDVTVKVTATNGTDTVNKTFTYRKEFNGNVTNETANARSVVASASTARAGSSGTLASQYSTNGSGYGKEGTITIDGSISDWNESMLVAQGAAWDVPNHWKGTHENCVIDTYALYAAYDDDNLYIGLQMVNVGDSIYYQGCGALLDGGVPGDVPFVIAIDTGKGNKMTGELTGGGYVWGAQVDFNRMADNLLYMSCKPGLGTPSIFKAGTDGLTNYTDTELCISFKDAGISYDVAHDCLPNTLIGLDHNEGQITDILDSNGPWVDYKKFTANEGTTHSSQYDSFFEVAIPYTALGITKSYLTQNGVGVLAVGTRGESGLDCIPYDYDAMTDNIMGDYGNDPSTSGEKDDVDVLTVSYARIGKEGGSGPTPPIPPTPTDPIVNFGADRSSPQLNTTQLSLEAIASNGTSPYQYEFFVDGVSVQSKSSADTYTWKPTVGNHTIKVTVTDSNGKTVSSQKAYEIEEDQGDLDDPTDIKISFKNETATYVYNGQEYKPEVIVKDGTKTLAEGTDYILEYEHNIYAADKNSTNAPKVIIVGKGNYAAKIDRELTFTIEKAEIPAGAPDSEMTVVVGPIANLDLSSGWEWSDSSIEIQEGVTISTEVVYNGMDKENYKTTTVTVSLTGISCNHVGTQRETIIIKQATCTQAGSQKVICATCHATISEGQVIPALGHIGGTATCVSQAVCARCGESYGGLDSDNHIHTVVKNKKEATCQQAGYTGDTTCEDCHTTIYGTPIAKTTNHVWDAGTVTKAATATTDGVRTYTCTVCGEKKTETIPKTGGATTEQGGTTTEQGGTTTPVVSLKAGDPVEDAASKGIYKVIKATSTVKTVEFTLPSSNVKAVTIPDQIVVNGIAYQVTSIAGNAFKNNKTVQTVNMGSNIKTIGESAFYGCSNLKKVTLSKNLTTIGNMAFYKCTKLTSITIPSKVSKIGSKAFYGCSSLKKVTLSSSLTTIGSQAFYKCIKLTSITIPSKVSKIGSKAFYGCKKLKKITIKTKKLTSKKVGSKAFKGIAAKATIKVPKTKLTSYKKILKAKGVGSKAKITK